MLHCYTGTISWMMYSNEVSMADEISFRSERTMAVEQEPSIILTVYYMRNDIKPWVLQYSRKISLQQWARSPNTTKQSTKCGNVYFVFSLLLSGATAEVYIQFSNWWTCSAHCYHDTTLKAITAESLIIKATASIGSSTCVQESSNIFSRHGSSNVKWAKHLRREFTSLLLARSKKPLKSDTAAMVTFLLIGITAWWLRNMTLCVNNMPKIVTWKWDGRELNLQPLSASPTR